VNGVKVIGSPLLRRKFPAARRRRAVRRIRIQNLKVVDPPPAKNLSLIGKKSFEIGKLRRRKSFTLGKNARQTENRRVRRTSCFLIAKRYK
jgi:hypothetical protein